MFMPAPLDIRQASLQEVREKTDKTLRPDWINLPE